MHSTQNDAQVTTRPLQRYDTENLREFRRIILEKLADTEATLGLLEGTLLLDRNNGTDDTYRTHNVQEDGQETMEREEAARMVIRQRKFQQELKSALARIEQGTYGICRATGRLIPAERLRAVPHATLCVEAKR